MEYKNFISIFGRFSGFIHRYNDNEAMRKNGEMFWYHNVNNNKLVRKLGQLTIFCLGLFGIETKRSHKNTSVKRIKYAMRIPFMGEIDLIRK